MLFFTKPGVKLSKGLPNKVTSDSNIRHTSLVGAEEMDQEVGCIFSFFLSFPALTFNTININKCKIILHKMLPFHAKTHQKLGELTALPQTP